MAKLSNTNRGSVLLAKRTQRARNIVHLYAGGSSVVGASPIPYSDMPVLAGIQIKMVYDIGRLFDECFDMREAALITTTIGAGSFGLREIFRQTVKVIPGAGWAVAGTIAAGGTEAFGHMAIAYFENRYGWEI